MKTAKLVIGIISMVLFVLVDNGEVSGTSGMLLAFCMLIAGIVGVATRKSKGGGIVAGVFYLLGGLLGIVNYGSFSDLAIWSVLCFIFGAVFILGSLKMKKADKSNTDAAELYYSNNNNIIPQQGDYFQTEVAALFFY